MSNTISNQRQFQVLAAGARITSLVFLLLACSGAAVSLGSGLDDEQSALTDATYGNPPVPNDTPEDCAKNPLAPGCPTEEVDCEENPLAAGCPTEEVDCEENPLAAGCPTEEVDCEENPLAPGCPTASP